MATKKEIKRYRCCNYGACTKADDNVIIEFDTIETLGGTPECPECHQHTLQEVVAKAFPWKLIGIIAGAVIVLAIIGGIIAMSDGDKETPKEPEPATVAPADSDNIKAAQMAAENQRLKDSLAAVQAANAEKEKAATERPATAPAPAATPAPKPVASSGSKDLGYATFNGTWPNDVNGRMEFKSSHVIDSRDPKGRMAEAGDYVIGEWADGHLVQGIWYGADNQVKGSILIGK